MSTCSTAVEMIELSKNFKKQLTYKTSALLFLKLDNLRTAAQATICTAIKVRNT